MTEFRLVNGINADQLFETIDLVKFNPDLAFFKFRAQNTWITCISTIHIEIAF